MQVRLSGFRARLVPAIAVMTLALPQAAAPPAMAQKQMTPTGVWQSPGGNTRLRIAPCGQQLCGQVAWASPQAKADAARAGHDNLVGMQLFEQFSRTGPNTFEGRVFVPDLNRHFNGRLTMSGPRTIEVRGCIAGRVGCRTDTWTKVG
ncbi:MAG: DUF2147 domain-containing protein [Thermaurantiacus sp.]